MNNIKNNLEEVKNRITAYEQKYERLKGSVNLLAVSKGQALEKILEAYRVGQRHFGENLLQEALPKMVALKEILAQEKNDSVEWHFIGSIQKNKTRKIAEHFTFVHSVSDQNTLKRLNEQRPENLSPLSICIQVNISQEASKSGVSIEEAIPLAEYCLSLPRLRLRGLMAIPKASTNLHDARAAFHPMLSLWQKMQKNGFEMDTLSMGMSDDFEAAIAEGATLVRIGTLIFGTREKRLT